MKNSKILQLLQAVDMIILVVFIKFIINQNFKLTVKYILT